MYFIRYYGITHPITSFMTIILQFTIVFTSIF